MELVSSSYETPEEMEIDVGAFGDFVAVSWGGLTSSKLQAPSYEEAVKCEPTTDHRLPTTMAIAEIGWIEAIVKRALTTKLKSHPLCVKRMTFYFL